MKKNKDLSNKVWRFLFERQPHQKPDADVEKVIRRLSWLSRSGNFDEEKIWTQLKNRTTTPKKTQTLLYRNIAGYAAAAMLILLIGSVIFLNNNGKDETAIEWAIVAHESDSRDIRLTLGGGETVVLPEGKNVMVAEDNSLVYGEQKNATLSYNRHAAQKMAEKPEYNTLEIPVTRNYRLELSDGSVVHLNSDTRIRYPKSFAQNERRIFLEKGEAYFEVAKNEKAPFVVEVRNTAITVLGTAFNINAYAEETSVKTTLVAGSVKVNTPQNESLLLPGQQAVANNATLSVLPVDVQLHVGWKDGFCIFRQKSLEAVMQQIYRWYGCTILFTDNNLKNLTLTGVIDRSLPLEEMFRILEKTNRINIKMEGENSVIVSPRK